MIYNASFSHPQKQRTIAIVANTTWNIYNFRLNILTILTKKHYQVIVIAPKDEYEIYQKAFPTVKHISLNHLARKSINPFQDMRLCQELFQIYQREKPDLILHYTIKANIYGGLAATLLNINYICVVTGLGYSFLHKGLVSWITQKLYQVALKQATRVVFENKDDQTLFRALNLVSIPQSIAVNGCGIDTTHFQPMPKTQRLTDFIFCFIGRFLWDKGFLEFVEAAKIVRQTRPQTQFWVVGSPDVENPSSVPQAQIDQWISAQIIVNQGFATDVRTWIREADCVVLPSYREGMPTILAEAGAMGKPIITTDVAGCRSIVEHGVNGYKVKPKSAQAVAEAMLKMAQLSAKQRRLMGEKGRQKIETAFDHRLIAASFLETIQQSLESKEQDCAPVLAF
jgi:glycosyltransferase involved in cell wall biosynthesis